MLDDTEDADVLPHLLPSISFIQAELDKGRGVIVHCLAGVSALGILVLLMCFWNLTTPVPGRSTTIVAAYLMYSKKLDPQSALELIRKARPIAEYVFFDIKPLPF